MVVVSVSETYDLSTIANKMSLIGIHTPSREIIEKTYPGLLMNSRYIRILSQDVTLACASVLPASVTQVGFEDADVAPEDLFNPILYKAVSNDSFSTLEARLQGLKYDAISSLALKGPSVEKTDHTTALSDDFGVYYSLLSNDAGFKKANPQRGLEMRKLRPLVFERFYNNAENVSLTTDATKVIVGQSSGTSLTVTNREGQYMRGNAHPMPKFNTTYITNVAGTGTSSQSNGIWPNGMGDALPRNSQISMPEILPVYTACICMPPSRLHKLYYRMVVRTFIEFTEIRPIQDIAAFYELNSAYASTVYHTDYTEQSKTMTAKTGMVDVEDAEITKIMEGV